MKRRELVLSVLSILTIVSIVYAIIPPPIVNQNIDDIDVYDTSIYQRYQRYQRLTNAPDQSDLLKYQIGMFWWCDGNKWCWET
jgi:hypothetical protein